MPISECYQEYMYSWCYLPKFNIQPHYHRLIIYIHVYSISIDLSLSVTMVILGCVSK